VLTGVSCQGKKLFRLVQVKNRVEWRNHEWKALVRAEVTHVRVLNPNTLTYVGRQISQLPLQIVEHRLGQIHRHNSRPGLGQRNGDPAVTAAVLQNTSILASPRQDSVVVDIVLSTAIGE